MTSRRTARELLPPAVSEVLEEFGRGFSVDFRLWRSNADSPVLRLYPPLGPEEVDEVPGPSSLLLPVASETSPGLTLEVRDGSSGQVRAAATALRAALEHLYRYSDEVQAFTYEVAERYEEINLLYSISETLGSLLPLNEAAHIILAEVCEVIGARRGSLWVADVEDGPLRVVASVGAEGLEGPLEVGDATAVTARVFREGRPVILSGKEVASDGGGAGPPGPNADSSLSVPIRYSPPQGEPRTVGVINLFGRKRGGRFTGSDQKLLSAIASQVGAALENNRLIHESLRRERVGREMELAHDLQMKLLPTAETFDPDRVAARVEPTESVGGDFYHFFRVRAGRYGVMIGDVSSHGFPAALIMALSMSAATIYASEVASPARVLGAMGEALMDELETTEMYLTLFYGVVDPDRGELVYANAGHPHAFLIRGDGRSERLEAMQPPMGIAGAVEYEQRAVPWSVGEDLLLLFTDGLSEDVAAASRNAGERRVVDEAVRLRDRPVDEIVEALFALQCRGQEKVGEGDDRTAVVLRV